MSNPIKGKIIKVLDSYNVVINKGANDGVKEEQEFMVYYNDDELFDPDTRESLGFLEIVCGIGKPSHIQEKMTTLTSSRYNIIENRKIVKKTHSDDIIRPFASILGGGNRSTTEETSDPPVKHKKEFTHIARNETQLLFKQIK